MQKTHLQDATRTSALSRLATKKAMLSRIPFLARCSLKYIREKQPCP